MCRILKMSFSGGNISVEVSSDRNLDNCAFELYLYDFSKGEYPSKPLIKQVINSSYVTQDSGIYRFKYTVPDRGIIKCVISKDDCMLVSKERFIGDRYKISVSIKNSEVGPLYSIVSEIALSKKMIFYRAPKTELKINIPEDLEARIPSVFAIKNTGFRPKFECAAEFIECFNIEG